MIKSKTLWFALALAVFGALEATLNLFQELIPAAYYGATFMVISIIVAVLRVITTTPLSEK